jgi:hypothetical protein
MNAISPTDIDHKSNGMARKGRISARVRHAVTLKVEKGLTGEQCAALAGLSNAGFWKAWKQPHVQALYESLKHEYIMRVMDRKPLLKARAYEVAEELMGPDQPPAVRARMVEFIAGEGRGPAVAVQINNAPAHGYTYRRPDTVSEVDKAQAIDVTAQPSKPE